MQAQGIRDTAINAFTTIGNGIKETAFWAGRQAVWIKDTVVSWDIPAKIYDIAAFVFSKLQNVAVWGWEVSKTVLGWSVEKTSAFANVVLDGGKAAGSWTLRTSQVSFKSAQGQLANFSQFLWTNPGFALIGGTVAAGAVVIKEMDLAGHSRKVNIALQVGALAAAAFAGYALGCPTPILG